jgi:hypothetical protein
MRERERRKGNGEEKRAGKGEEERNKGREGGELVVRGGEGWNRRKWEGDGERKGLREDEW